MALRRRFLPVFKKHAPRGKPRFAKPLQGHFGPAAKHSQKHKNRPKIGRFSHFNPSAEMHPFSLFSASKAPQKWLCDAICRKKQLFAGSFGSRSHSFCSFTDVERRVAVKSRFTCFRAHHERICFHVAQIEKPRFPLAKVVVEVVAVESKMPLFKPAVHFPPFFCRHDGPGQTLLVDAATDHPAHYLTVCIASTVHHA